MLEQVWDSNIFFWIKNKEEKCFFKGDFFNS